jgi:4-diphosphocytidyl-2-C-methyl-D-erythritol kinase
MGNDLERCIAAKHPEIDLIKQQFLDAGAIGAMMTGSGSAVFGVFRDKESADRAYAGLRAPKRLVYTAEPV